MAAVYVAVAILVVLLATSIDAQEAALSMLQQSTVREYRWRRSPWYGTEEATRDWRKDRFSMLVWILGSTQHAARLRGGIVLERGCSQTIACALEMRHISVEGCCRVKTNPLKRFDGVWT